MKIQGTLFTILFGLSFFLTNCNLSDENRFQQELAKKDSIIDLQKRIIDKQKKYCDYDTIIPIIVHENSNIKLGDSYNADIYVSAFKSNDQFKVILCDSIDTVHNKMYRIKLQLDMSNGLVSYQFKPKKKGKYFLQGGIKYYGDSTDKIYLFKKEYHVN